MKEQNSCDIQEILNSKPTVSQRVSSPYGPVPSSNNLSSLPKSNYHLSSSKKGKLPLTSASRVPLVKDKISSISFGILENLESSQKLRITCNQNSQSKAIRVDPFRQRNSA